MRLLAILAFVALLSACAAKLTFVDRSDGSSYAGTTGGTSGGAGDATATIAGQAYAGQWLYQASGGAFTLATSGRQQRPPAKCGPA